MQTTKDNGAVASQQRALRNINHEKYFSTSLRQVEHALAFIDAPDRDTWIKCGMAIKSKFGNGGFDGWEKWGVCHD